MEIDEDSDDDDEPIDWWAFWRDVDEGEVGDDDMEDERDMEVTAQQKVRQNFNRYIIHYYHLAELCMLQVSV